jgi:hypothetical protein
MKELMGTLSLQAYGMMLKVRVFLVTQLDFFRQLPKTHGVIVKKRKTKKPLKLQVRKP